MNDQPQSIPAQNFNAQVMMTNVSHVKGMIQRIRQKDAVGSEGDELILHRLLYDLESLVEVADTLKRMLNQHSQDKPQT